MGISSADVRRYMAARGTPVEQAKQRCPVGKGPKSDKKQRSINDGGLNDTEKAYRNHLRLLVVAGDVLWFTVHPFKLRLADNTTYIPDFMVQWADRSISIDETKGWERDDAVVKFKVAADIFPCFRFRMIKREGGAWVVTRDLNAVAA